MTVKLLLASGSSYRRQQLAQLQLDFEWRAPNIDEQRLADESASDLALRLGLAKARAVAKEIKGYLIIAGDQTAALNDQILGKPGSAEQAQLQLAQCSGNTVTFFSSLCILNSDSGDFSNEIVPTEVKFRHLSSTQIQRYVERDQPLDCAGSFKCESLGIALFESIASSDPSALIGLPLIQLSQRLSQFDFDVLS